VRVVQQAHRRCVAHVGAFQRGQGHADDAGAEGVLGDGLGMGDAEQQPAGPGHTLEVAHLVQERCKAG